MAYKLILAAFAATALAAPVEERQSCSNGVWSQCGGQNWSGTPCCTSGNKCVKLNDFYSQCQPGTAEPSSTTATKTTATGASSTTAGGSVTSAPPAASGNPYSGVDLWANSYYRSEVMNLAVPKLSGARATAAAKVADVPSFQWMDTYDHISLMQDTLADIRKANKAGGNYAGQFVVYDLPNRDCAAAASNGEYSLDKDGANKYKAYIAKIKGILQDYSDTKVILVIEPDSLANLVTNLNVDKCAKAESAYKELTVYAIKELNLPNVTMYLDAGHGGWLGWPANIGPAAKLFAQIYKDAGKPSRVRGLEGWSNVKFIVDQGRSGKQPTGQKAQGDWCNAKGTGFGLRPSTNTGDALADAFVWVKPGGESDGTSDTSAARYDYHCGLDDALKPAPEAGTWFQAYFEQLLDNANPSFL
ncbi:hypothetical protein LB503_010023 [Fusarium chuoi]|nr:hypothetical protein LB503_010023 [Fusarium chuoi]